MTLAALHVHDGRTAGKPSPMTKLRLGLVFGFVPTVHGTALSVLAQWLGDETFWRIQQQLRLADASQPFEAADNILRHHLELAMQIRPVPPLLHRTATVDRTLGEVAVKKGKRVVLIMSGATHEALDHGKPDVGIVFGGNRDDTPRAASAQSERHPTHACPGSHIAIGVLLGFLSAVFHIGTCAPTPSQFTIKVNRPDPYDGE